MKVVINGKEYEPIPAQHNKYDCVWIADADGGKWYGSVKEEKVEKKEYQVMLETLKLSQLIANERIGGQLRLTRKTAEALAEAIEAAIDYITGNKDALPVLVSLKAARGSYQDKEMKL